MKPKRGQITLFIVLGLIIVIAVGLLFFVGRKEESTVTMNSQSVQLSFESCLKEIGLPGLYLAGSKGGTIYTPVDALTTENEQIATGKLDTSVIQNDLSRFIKASIPFCLQQLDFPHVTYDENDIDVKTRIRQSDIQVHVQMSVKVKNDNIETTLSDFTEALPVRLGNILTIRDEIIQDNSKMIDFDKLSSYDVEVSIIPYNKQTMIYELTDHKVDPPFKFRFVQHPSNSVAGAKPNV